MDLVVARDDGPERAAPQDVSGEGAVEHVSIHRIDGGLKPPDEVDDGLNIALDRKRWSMLRVLEARCHRATV